MATRDIPRGPTGRTVSQNVARLIKSRGMTTAQLSEELTKVGRPILPTGITKIIKGGRRVDADDLMALAIALNVTPLTLLLPNENLGDRQAVTGDERIAGLYWEWALGHGPLRAALDDEDAWLDYHRHAIPKGYRQMQDFARRIQQQARDEAEPAATQDKDQ